MTTKYEHLTCPIDLKAKIDNQEYTLESADPISGGLIHRVMRINSTEQTSRIIKIRESYFQMIRDIKIDPNKIDQEYRSLNAVSKTASDDTFPSVVDYNKAEHRLIISDISEGCFWFEDFLNKNVLSEDLVAKLAVDIQELHSKLKSIDPEPLSSEENSKEYLDNILYRLSRFNIPQINEIVDKLRLKPRQYIFGDLSPKNLFLDEASNKLRFCDLEMMHRGNIEFDHAFFLAHLLLHQKANHQTIFDTYYNHSDLKIDKTDLLKLIKGVLLYRLVNQKIPYNQTHINPTSKIKIAQKILKEIDSTSLEDLFQVDVDELEVESKILDIDKELIIEKLVKLNSILVMDEETQISRWDVTSFEKIDMDCGNSIIQKIINSVKQLTALSSSIDDKNAYLRLRKQGGQLELTLKVNQTESLGFKQEQETNLYFEESKYQFIIDELEKYGLACESQEVKRRASYLTQQGVRVDIDTWISPSIPTYIEIEGSQSSILETADHLGFSEKELSNISGKELFKKYAS